MPHAPQMESTPEPISSAKEFKNIGPCVKLIMTVIIMCPFVVITASGLFVWWLAVPHDQSNEILFMNAVMHACYTMCWILYALLYGRRIYKPRRAIWNGIVQQYGDDLTGQCPLLEGQIHRHLEDVGQHQALAKLRMQKNLFLWALWTEISLEFLKNIWAICVTCLAFFFSFSEGRTQSGAPWIVFGLSIAKIVTVDIIGNELKNMLY